MLIRLCVFEYHKRLPRIADTHTKPLRAAALTLAYWQSFATT